MAKTIIDVHSHIVPQNYVAALEGHGRLLEDGFPCPKWSMESQYAFMESVGILIASCPCPPPIRWWALWRRAYS